MSDSASVSVGKRMIWNIRWITEGMPVAIEPTPPRSDDELSPASSPGPGSDPPPGIGGSGGSGNGLGAISAPKLASASKEMSMKTIRRCIHRTVANYRGGRSVSVLASNNLTSEFLRTSYSDGISTTFSGKNIFYFSEYSSHLNK